MWRFVTKPKKLNGTAVVDFLLMSVGAIESTARQGEN
jgi:hypothetical protein